MNRSALIVALCALAAAAGCASIHTAHDFAGVNVDGNTKPIATVAVENYGWYFLDFLPVITGNPERPNANSCRFFHDTVTLQNNLKMLGEKMRGEKAAHLSNVSTHIDDSCSVGFFIFSRRVITTSAVITEPPPVDPYNLYTPRHGVPPPPRD